MTNRHFAIHPDDFKLYTTIRVREHFLLHDLFSLDEIVNHYTHYDRMIVGGAMPSKKPLPLTTFDSLKAEFYLERRELGIFNVGAPGVVEADGISYKLKFKESLYIGRGVKHVIFHPSKEGQARYYFNSAPAHTSYPTRKLSLEDGETMNIGTQETSNARTIRKLIVNNVLPTCQLQMGLTELKQGSVWNTMPPHTHDRRMEVYFYFEIPENNTVCHFLGEPEETRHIWMKNNEAVLSPPWSIHAGAGTSSYSFIWSMAGENMDYSDMDLLKPTDLK